MANVNTITVSANLLSPSSLSLCFVSYLLYLSVISRMSPTITGANSLDEQAVQFGSGIEIIAFACVGSVGRIRRSQF